MAAIYELKSGRGQGFLGNTARTEHLRKKCLCGLMSDNMLRTERDRYGGGGVSQFCGGGDFMQILDVGLYVRLYVCRQYISLTALTGAKMTTDYRTETPVDTPVCLITLKDEDGRGVTSL